MAYEQPVCSKSKGDFLSLNECLVFCQMLQEQMNLRAALAQNNNQHLLRKARHLLLTDQGSRYLHQGVPHTDPQVTFLSLSYSLLVYICAHFCHLYL